MKKRILPNGLLFTIPIAVICAVWLTIAGLFITSLFVDDIKALYNIFIIIIAVTAILMIIILALRFAFRITFTESVINYAYWTWSIEKITRLTATVIGLKRLYKGERTLVFEYEDGKKATIYIDFFSKKQTEKIIGMVVTIAQDNGVMLQYSVK